jgi:3-polyprenyl-4-hydroxybenzoate decarboxylase
MNTTKKIVIGVGLASGALLATWLLTGSRKQKTKEFVSKRAEDLRKAFKSDRNTTDDNEIHYV